MFIADPGQIEVLTDPFSRGGSGGYSTDLDQPVNRSYPQFAGSELDLPANGEVNAPSGQTQPLLGVRALGWVIQKNRGDLLTVVFALIVLLLITSSSMYYAERSAERNPTNSPEFRGLCGGASLR